MFESNGEVSKHLSSEDGHIPGRYREVEQICFAWMKDEEQRHDERFPKRDTYRESQIESERDRGE